MKGKTRDESGKAQRFPKTDARYWRDRVFHRTDDETDGFHVRMRHGGRQYRWPLHTANREQAAAKARDIFLSLKTGGYDATEEKFKPWTADRAKHGPLTVGEFIAAVRAIATVAATTFTTYERKFRFLVSQVKTVASSRAKFNYATGGTRKWRQRIDDALLGDITPEAVMKWRVGYITKHSADPLAQNAARSTTASILRNSKALFSPKLLRNLSLPLPSPLPFDGVDIGKRPRTRYKSKINAPLLLRQANAELKDDRPELFKVFLLGIGAGLRRSEIDRLAWKQFNWQTGRLSIEVTEYGGVKTEGSAEEIDIGADMLGYFKTQFAKSTSEFVVRSAVETGKPKHWHHYRCDRTFKDLIDWLREKGIEVRNPIHTLRKEFGSLINQRFGLFAASAALRHSNISITRESYVDRKERIALDLGELALQNKGHSQERNPA